ncbi:hypothetical protein GCM10009098_10590 [Rheinheimera aquimaris]|uniref:Bacteriophage N4 adsorption protein A C-terminal domain-containing protein n=1 Tax=Rheinheimera aquimaris TaxID=412437 RepID=A0ABP3NLL9_9GAMM|nr:hypothetical protein [Rheinheimera aquimaris]MCB5212903.1 hypothetical protein [Rheinheimera aquimaris]
MMTRLALALPLLLCSLWLQAQPWQDGLTELQQFRAYPYVNKAFSLQSQQQFAAAAIELEKALRVVPQHAPLLLMLFDYQLAIPDTSAALRTYQLIPASQRQGNLLRLAQTQLDLQQPLALTQFAALLDNLTVAERWQLSQLVAQHLIAQQQLQQALDWLLAQPVLSDALLLQRAELASLLSLPKQVISDTEAVSISSLAPQDWRRYLSALLQQQLAEKAARLADSHAGSEWAVWFYQQWLQMQLADKDWLGAESSFIWLSQHSMLSSQQQLQRYHTAIHNQQLTLAAKLISQLDVSCLKKVEMYLQADAVSKAGAQFALCPVQSSSTWLGYAERWLSADELAAVKLTNATLASQQVSMLTQKRIAAKNYQALLQQKFSQPLQQQDYAMLVASISELPDPIAQLHYFSRLYQAMPDDYLLDKLSYLYLTQGQHDEALSLLLHALPFSAAALAEKSLPERLLNLLLQRPNMQTPAILQQLDHWTQFHSSRAELWRLAGNCDKAQHLLAPAPSTAAGWQTLALCANNWQPATAIQFWRQAYQLQQQSSYLKQIAYQHQAMNESAAALAQFQQLPASDLLPADLLTMAELAIQQGDTDIAARYLNQAKPDGQSGLARSYAIRATLYGALHQAEPALQSWRQAAQLQPQRSAYQLGYAYALAETTPRKALEIMQQLQSSGYQFSATEAAQLAYLNQRLLLQNATSYWTNRALLLYPQQTDLTDAELVAQFSLVRLQQQLQSHWQFSSSATFTSGAVTGERLVADSTELAKHGIAVKAEYFINPLQRDLSLYALLAGSGNDSPWQNGGHQLGISYKPWHQHNLWLSAGIQQYPLAEGDWQSLLRLTADILNQTPWQAEWRPVQQRWWERKLYIDAVWWPEADNQLLQLRFDQGAVWKLDSNLAQTMKWYGLAQFDFRRQQNDSGLTDSGKQLTSGMGVQWRFWLGQTPARLQRQRFEVNLEWQYQLTGDLNQRQHALLLQFYAAW